MNNKKPKLSIVTIVYNAENYLEKTIKSIINQTYENIEYIVIDGASTDNTIQIIKQYESNITKWKSEKDKGIYDAMNKGIDLATGDFIWFINAGDEIYDNNTVEQIFNHYNNEDVFYGQMQLIKEDGSYASIVKTPKEITYKSFKHGMAASHQAIIIKRSLIEHYNLNYTVVSDHDWIINALKKTTNIKNTNLIVSKYLLGGFSNKNFYKGWREKLTIMKTQFGLFTYLLNYIYFIKAASKETLKTILRMQ